MSISSSASESITAGTIPPLQGIRVLEFGGYLAAPYAGALFASLGAEVIKIEPAGGEPFRRGRDNTDHFFRQYNLGKKSVELDVTTPEGRETAIELIRTSDVLIENMRAGKMDALGLGSDTCREVNPELIYASVTGFGNFGELRTRPAYDSIGQSISGMYSILSDPERPQMSGTCLADLSCGITVAMGVLAALVRRFAVNGSGAHLETSMIEAMTLLTIDAVTLYDERGVAPRRESRNPQAINFCMPTKDDAHITVHLSSVPKFWTGFAKAIGHPELVEDPRFADYYVREANYFELRELVRPVFLERTLDQWMEIFVAADVPCAPLLHIDGVVEHPHIKQMDLFTKGPEGNTIVETPWRIDGGRLHRPRTAPQVGEHTESVIGQLSSTTRA